MGVFIISTGRCGSTMLARMLRCNSSWLVIDEFFTTFRGGVDQSRPIDRRAFIKKLVSPISPRFVTRHFLDIEAALGRQAEELTYRRRPDARYDVYDCPCVLAVTLPSISNEPEVELDRLVAHADEPSPRRPFVDHALDLFDRWRIEMGKAVWIERSGWSTPYMDLVRQRAPETRFVYLRRDPAETVLSMATHPYFVLIGEIRTILARHGIDIDTLALGAHWLRDPILVTYVKFLQPAFGLPWRFDAYYGPAGYEKRLEVACDLYLEATRRAERFVASLPSDRVISVDYEDLVDDVAPELARIARFIGREAGDNAWAREAVAIPSRRPSKFATLAPDLAERLSRRLGGVGPEACRGTPDMHVPKGA